MRYRELCAAEERYLIANGWHSVKVRTMRFWKSPLTKGSVDYDTALAMQKQHDRETLLSPIT